jgi:hypothetical protein
MVPSWIGRAKAASAARLIARVILELYSEKGRLKEEEEGYEWAASPPTTPLPDLGCGAIGGFVTGSVIFRQD